MTKYNNDYISVVYDTFDYTQYTLYINNIPAYTCIYPLIVITYHTILYTILYPLIYIQSIARTTYLSMTSIIASYTLPNAEIFNHGLSLGTKLGDILTEITLTINNKYKLIIINNNDDIYTLKFILHIIGNISGIAISFIYRKIANVVTSCLIGSELITTAIVDLTTPILQHYELATLSPTPTTTTTALTATISVAASNNNSRRLILSILQGVFFTLGFARVRIFSSSSSGRGVGSIIEKVLLSPLLLVDNLITTLMIFARST